MIHDQEAIRAGAVVSSVGELMRGTVVKKGGTASVAARLVNLPRIVLRV